MKLIIHIDNPQMHYNPGSPIAGEVVLQLEAPTSISKVSVFMKGEGCVFWASGGRRKRQIHTSCEKYLSHELVMFDRQEGPEEIFPAGSTHFAYDFVIPDGCPSTFQSSRGSIVYVIEGVVSTSLLRYSHRNQRQFSVLEVIGIDVLGTRNPIHERTRAMVGHHCCHMRNDGNVGFSGEVLHSAFLMDEVIPVQIHIDNGCGFEVYARCEVVEKILFISSRSMYETHNILSEYETEVFRAYVNSGILHECLPIPRVRPAVTKSSIIHSQFFVRFILIIPRKKKEAVIEIPLWIGNTPIPDPPMCDDDFD